jgi:hypothetical protein
MVFEGQEKDEFWNHFPHGKEAYASDKRLGEHQSSLTNTNDHPARLYEISNATGRTTAIELPNFTQVLTRHTYLTLFFNDHKSLIIKINKLRQP